MSMASVELRPAFTFRCDECGHDNFGVMLPIDQCTLQAVIDDLESSGYKITVRNPDRVRIAPETVTCSECGIEFVAEIENEHSI